MTIISSLLGIFAGICLYVGLLHLLIASARLKSALHFWFGLTCLLCTSYILALMGIAIMKERAKSIGAIFHLSSYPGEGTEIVLSWSTGINKIGSGE